jgi:hypothetical protein
MNESEKVLWCRAKEAGVPRFNSSIACSICKSVERYTGNRSCVACSRLRSSAAYAGRLENDIKLLDLPDSRDEAAGCKIEFYFDGERCGRNHRSKRFTRTGKCFACVVKKLKMADQAKRD